MTHKQQRIAIAEACGWKPCKDAIDMDVPMFEKGDDIVSFGDLPDYLKCLNACHEMEKSLDPFSELARYIYQLQTICGGQFFGQNYLATAAQRSETFLRVKGLWKE